MASPASLARGLPVGRRRDRLPPALLAAGVLVAALALLPIVFLLIEAADADGAQAWDLVFRPRVGTLMLHTLGVLAAATALSAVIGIGAAWFVERTDIPLRRLWAVVFVLPLAVPEFVASFGWVSLFPSVHGYFGAVLVTVLSYFPFVYLPCVAVLRSSDAGLEEASRSLGLGEWETFRRVTLPQMRLPVLGGGLVIALHLLAEYGSFAQLRFPTFATEIYDQYELSFSGSNAAVLSLILVALCLVCLLVEVIARGRRRYARVGGGVARRHTRVRLGRATAPALMALGTLAGLSLGVPLTALGYWMVKGNSSTLPDASLLDAATTSVALAAAAAAVTVLLALPVAVIAVRHASRGGRLLERATFLPRALPGIVVALALVTFSIRSVRDLYQTSALLVLAYVILFMPLAVVALRGSVAQVGVRSEEMARTLGLGAIPAFPRGTLPSLGGAIGAGATLVFVSTVTELTGTLLLIPTGNDTLATQFWAYTSKLSYGGAAPFALAMVAISAVPTYFLVRKVDSIVS